MILRLLFLAVVVWVIYALFKRSNTKNSTLPSKQKLEGPQVKTEVLAASKDVIDLYLKRAQECALPSIRVIPKQRAPDSAIASRFGGVPWWPEGVELPANKDGQALKMLAQINLAELPENPLLPSNGLLQFFIATDDLMGLAFATEGLTQNAINKEQNGFRVVFHPDVLLTTNSLTEYEPLEKSEYAPISDEYSLEFESCQDVPSPSDCRWSALSNDLPELDDATEDALYDALDSSGSKIGGYAYFTQEDPRAYLGAGQEWELLLQIDTEHEGGVDIMWGDSGVANFFVPKGSLDKMDFSEVWYNWDCC